MKVEHIEKIRDVFDVSLEEIARYNKSHKMEVEKMEDIFIFNDENKIKILALLYLLSFGKEDDIIRIYRSQTNMDFEHYSTDNLINENKITLITAMIYNKYFYTMAINCRGIFAEGFDVAIKKDDSEYKKILQFEYVYESKRIIFSDIKAATRPGVKEVFLDTIDWKNNKCDVYYILDQNGKISFELHIKNTNELENAEKIKFIISIIKDNKIIKEKLRFDRWATDTIMVYSSGPADIISGGEIIINELVGSNDV